MQQWLEQSLCVCVCVCVCVWGGGGGGGRGAGERWLSGYYRPKKVENQFSFRAVQCVLLMA